MMTLSPVTFCPLGVDAKTEDGQHYLSLSVTYPSANISVIVIHEVSRIGRSNLDSIA